MTSLKPSRSKRTRNVIVGVVIAVVAVVLAAGGYWLFVGNENTDPPASNLKATTIQKNSASSNTVGRISTMTKHYVSTGFMVEFDYPSDWTIADAAGATQLTATSPTVRLKGLDGQSFDGQVILTLRNKQQPLPEFDKGNAIAARESEKINYTKPSSVQRGSTYLSFLRYAGQQPGSLEGVYITGNVGYQLAQAVPKADFTPVDPVVSITFQKCAAHGCNAQTNSAVGISPAMWDEGAFGTPLKSMLQSLTIN